jgi:catechol 2,3-dioxygenase-like lactoylglutathione lyase family enzyme
MLRFDHLGVVVEDLDTAVDFFTDLGFERSDSMELGGSWVDRINGLDGVRAEMVMVRTPDGTGNLELVKYHAPVSGEAAGFLPANRPGFRHICLQVADLDAALGRLRAKGYGTVGTIEQYEDVYRLCYVHGPEGLIVELAERIGPGTAGDPVGARQ